VQATLRPKVADRADPFETGGGGPIEHQGINTIDAMMLM
jgi:hypothetical protein